jgi:hypothetical protein
MAVLVRAEWDGFGSDQYDQLIELLNMEHDPAPGFIYHIASEGERGIEITGVWESLEDFQRYGDTRLAAAIQQLGLSGRPQITFQPVRRIITPG